MFKIRADKEEKDLIEKFNKSKENQVNVQRIHSEDNECVTFLVKIKGPENTPYKGHIIELIIDVFSNYPSSPPKLTVQQRRKYNHPNISRENGMVYLSVFHQQNWSPVLRLEQVIESFIDILKEPDFRTFINSEAVRLYYSSKEEYQRIVKELLNTK